MLRIWRSQLVQGLSASLLSLTVIVVLLTSVPGYKVPDWPWNLIAVGATVLAFILGLPTLLSKDVKND